MTTIGSNPSIRFSAIIRERIPGVSYETFICPTSGIMLGATEDDAKALLKARKDLYEAKVWNKWRY